MPRRGRAELWRYGDFFIKLHFWKCFGVSELGVILISQNGPFSEKVGNVAIRLFFACLSQIWTCKISEVIDSKGATYVEKSCQVDVSTGNGAVCFGGVKLVIWLERVVSIRFSSRNR